MKKVKSPTFIAISVLFVALVIFFRSINNLTVTTDIQPVVTEKPKKVSCTRTTRLDNEPPYDRALSIIGERYRDWDDDYSSGKPSFSYFPSQLVNCIKIVEGNIRNSKSAEGYFTFNSAEIQDNYFPVTVDESYIFTDDYVNALLLVHEITHVEQYIKHLNGEDKLSCIDKEVEAFYASLELRSLFGNEAFKSIQLRIDYDKNLHPQLQILKIFQNNYNIHEVPTSCDVKCIQDFQMDVLKKILLKSNAYNEQCNL